jgi:hypothetical protein
MKLIDYVGGFLDKKSSAQQQQPDFPADLDCQPSSSRIGTMST